MIRTTHRLLVGDSRELSSIPAESVHLVVTSPPYPMIEMWDGQFGELCPESRKALADGDGRLAFELMHRELDKCWAEIHRVLVPGGFVCINIGDAARSIDGEFQLYTNHARILGACRDLGFRALPLILWRKQTNTPNKFMGSGMLPAGAYVTLEHEYVLVLRQGDKRRFDDPEARIRRREGAVFWEERNQWYSDVWDFKGTHQSLDLGPGRGRERSGAFPFELAYRLVNMYSLPGDTVLDPFVGTGTTCLAAMAACRSSLGIDLDPALHAESVRRMSDGVEAVNARISARLEAHRKFVAERIAAGGLLRYRNGPHDVPVVASQETDLRLRFAGHLDRRGDTITVIHTDTPPPLHGQGELEL